eukprot:219335_1
MKILWFLVVVAFIAGLSADTGKFSDVKFLKASRLFQRNSARRRAFLHTVPNCFMYTFRKRCNSFCKSVITQKRQVLATKSTILHVYPTIGLKNENITSIQWQFDNIEKSLGSNGTGVIKVTYNKKYYYPERIFIDRVEWMADEEERYFFSDLKDMGDLCDRLQACPELESL